VDFPSPCNAVGHISIVEKPPLAAARVHLHLHPAHPLPSTRGHTPINRTACAISLRCACDLISSRSIVLNQALEAHRGEPVVGETKRSPPVTARVCLSGGPVLCVGWGECAWIAYPSLHTPADHGSMDSQRSGSTLDVREHQGECYFAVLRFTRTSNDHTRLGVRHPLRTAPLICNASIHDVHSLL